MSGSHPMRKPTEDSEAKTRLRTLERLGFELDRHPVELTGVCRPCRAQGRSAEPGRLPDI